MGDDHGTERRAFDGARHLLRRPARHDGLKRASTGGWTFVSRQWARLRRGGGNSQPRCRPGGRRSRASSLRRNQWPHDAPEGGQAASRRRDHQDRRIDRYERQALGCGIGRGRSGGPFQSPKAVHASLWWVLGGGLSLAYCRVRGDRSGWSVLRTWRGSHAFGRSGGLPNRGRTAACGWSPPRLGRLHDGCHRT